MEIFHKQEPRLSPEEISDAAATAHNDQVFAAVNDDVTHLIEHARDSINKANRIGAAPSDAGAALGLWLQERTLEPYTLANLLAVALMRLVPHTPPSPHDCGARLNNPEEPKH